MKSPGVSKPRGAAIDLWFTFPDAIRDERLLESYRAMLTDDERQQEKRFYFARDRHQYVVTRALVRTSLSLYAPVCAQDWRFVKNNHGRPQVAPVHGSIAVPEFNISHTNGAILCAIAWRGWLGVDVEHLCRPRAPQQITRWCLSEKEIEELSSHPPDSQGARFLEYWTLKESYAKAVGKGLSIPFEQVSFTLSDAQVSLSLKPTVGGDDPRNWRFWLLKPSAEHVVAVCASRLSGRERSLVIRQVIPMVSQQPLQCQILHESGA